MKICKRCVLPEGFPRVTLDSEGVCSLCRAYEETKPVSSKLKAGYRLAFKRLVKKVAGKGTHDILVCYSGGKDSSYALSVLKNIYKLNILAFTVDNGFVPERTYLNIRNVVESLSVDHIFFKPRFDVLRKIFRASAVKSFYPPKSLERASTICTSCMGLVKYLAVKTAIEKDIPLIGFGWSPGQAPITSSILAIDPVMMKSMERILKGPMLRIAGRAVEAYFPGSGQYARHGRFPSFVHPLAFHDYSEKQIIRFIQKLGWRMPPGIDTNATNCLLNSFADKVHISKYGFHPYGLEIAALVRQGCMTRDEGLKHLPVRKNPKVLRMVRRKLGM